MPIRSATIPRRRHFILEPTHSGMQRKVEALSSARKTNIKTCNGDTRTHFLPTRIQSSTAGDKSSADSSSELTIWQAKRTALHRRMTRGVPTLRDTARPLLSTRDTRSQHGYEILPLQLTVRIPHSTSLISLVPGQAYRDDDLPWMIGDCSDFSHYTCAGQVATRARS